MTTEIITISPDASFEAVRRQIGQMRAERVALVLPDGWTDLGNLARMRLLQRQAQVQRSEIALVAKDEPTRQAAKQAGVPVFYHTQDVNKRNWKMDPLLPLVDPQHPDKSLPEPPAWRRDDLVNQQSRPTRFRARQQRIQAEERYRRPLPVWMQWLSPIFIGSLIGLLLFFFLIYILPAATITLVPGRDVINLTVALTADANIDEPDYEAAIIPARLLETNIEEVGSIATTGAQQKATENSIGEVVFSNLGNTTVNIPIGTVVTTSSGTPVSFATTSEAELPSGVGERVTVPVEALEPGVSGNVRANTINTVSGALRFRTRVTNQAGTYGGGSELVPVVTQADQDLLLAQLVESAEANALAKLQEELEPGEWLPPESVQTFVIAQVFDQLKDDEAETLGLTLRVLVQGMAVEAEEMNEAMLATLQDAVPEEGQIIAETFQAARTGDSEIIGRTTLFTTTASAEYVIPIDPNEVREEVVGLSQADALQAMRENWQIAGQPDIYQDPAWMPKLPRFPNRIQVRVEYAGALAVGQQ